MKAAAVLALVATIGAACAVSAHTDAVVADPDPVVAVQGLINRTLGTGYVTSFALTITTTDAGNDAFTLAPPSAAQADAGAVVAISGNNGVALAAGINWYLKYHCNAHISWGDEGTGNQLDLPSPLPAVTEPYTNTSPVQWRYTWNVCTFGYSMAFWDWSRWERELDYIALQGVNFPLAFVGQEYVWASVYEQLGLTEAEVEEHFSGMAFLPWERMGNMRGWGGPLTPDLRLQAFNMQKQILARARSFGMTPVPPAFAGHVPKGMQRAYPAANITRSPDWGRFDDAYCCDYLLEPTDPLFTKIGSLFVETYTKLLGSSGWWQGDTFNEMDPHSSDPAYLKAAGQAVVNAIHAAEPEGKWLMQGWLFHSGFWKDTSRIQAYLSGVADTDMLILDLNSDAGPVFTYTDSFFGKPFVWNMLENYGGRHGLYGNLPGISSQPLAVEQNKSYTMTGVGITPEAIENNAIAFELMLEMGWRSEGFSVQEWVANYTMRRFGCTGAAGSRPCPSAIAAWQQLLTAVYTNGGISVSLWELSPALTMNANTGPNATAVVEAFRLMYVSGLRELSSPPPGPYLIDLMDVTVQALSNLFVDLHSLFMTAYQGFQLRGQDTTARVMALGDALLALIADVDTHLGTNVNYLLGRWIADARAFGATPAEQDLQEMNARNQLTMWGPAENINDYAAKWWNGLVGNYYLGRWSLLVKGCQNCVTNPADPDCTTKFPSSYSTQLPAFEEAWSNATTPTFATEPSGDQLANTATLAGKYFDGNAAGYTAVAGTDAPGNDILAGQTWTKDVQQLQVLCDMEPSCKGFNTNGWLKTDVSTTIASPATLWIKK